jgi:hypothetical protein
MLRVNRPLFYRDHIPLELNRDFSPKTTMATLVNGRYPDAEVIVTVNFHP